ncbi:MAG: 2-dehydropantoate 2-reductase [Candidatus Omnitrophica bacterium]|nr:2-dehydropantoate 2-reductase [Candidatus Omnitrophota bacterium]
MKIAIVGPGAMGCLFGGFLSKAGEEITFLDHNKDRAKNISARGLRMEGISGEHIIPARAVCETKELGLPDLVIFCVKAYDTEKAVKALSGIAGKGALFLTLQNGIGNFEIIEREAGVNQALGGITSHGATLLGEGHIRHAGKGPTAIGFGKGVSLTQDMQDKLKKIVSAFNSAGFDTTIAGDVEGLLWSKLIINAGINALTGVTRLNNGRLIEYTGTHEILHGAVEEAIRVAQAKGVQLSYPDPLAKVEDVCRATAKNVSSMLQDVLKKRRTEIGFINGAIVREGERWGIPTPVNSVLTNLIKTLEESYPAQL